MTIKFIGQDKSPVQLQTLSCGDAFEITGTYYIKSDGFGDDDPITVRCMHVSGSKIGYFSHIDKTAQVMPVTLIVTLDVLDELPDDKPGWHMNGADKAEWALRTMLTATAPDHSDGATEMVDKPAEVPMPEPAKRTYTNASNSSDVRKGFAMSGELKDEWWSRYQMRTYGDAREAAGYAAGVAEERERWTGDTYHCTVKCSQCGHKNYFTRADLERGPDAALRGEVKP